MTEIRNINISLKNRFDVDLIDEVNHLSDIIENDMRRYDHIIDAEEETNDF